MKGFIKIKVSESKKEDNLLLFKIIDSGVGIKEGTIESLGEKAYQTHNQQGLNSKGIGLGLFICKKIIQQLGPNKSFKVKSQPNFKTQFSFEIYYKQERKTALSFCKKFKEKGELIRLKSAPAASFQFNKKKAQQQQSKQSQLYEQEGMETIAEKFQDCQFQINNANEEIENIRKGLIEVKSENSKQQQQSKEFIPSFNWAALNIDTKRNRSLSAEVKQFNENLSNQDSPEQENDFNNKYKTNTIQQITISPDIYEKMNEYSEQSLQQIQEIKIKPPQYFKEKSIISKDKNNKKPIIVRSQQKHLSSINLKNIVNKDNSPRFSSPIPILNILIADDDPFNLLILSSYFEKLKNQFSIYLRKAYNGEQAVDIFLELNSQSDTFNLNYIILDCQMPIMDGYNASFLIKQKIENENFINAVVIGYTAELGNEVEERCKSANMDGYIVKPATEKQFIEYLLSFLN